MNNLEQKSDRQTLAYEDKAFLDTDDARPIRILAEYLAPLREFRREGVHDTIVFFGSARLREDGALGRYIGKPESWRVCSPRGRAQCIMSPIV